jgi:hypothetical protein
MAPRAMRGYPLLTLVAKQWLCGHRNGESLVRLARECLRHDVNRVPWD